MPQTTTASIRKPLWVRASIYYATAMAISLTLGTMTYFSAIGLSGWGFFISQSLRFIEWSFIAPLIYWTIKRFKPQPPRRWYIIAIFHLGLGLLFLMAVSAIHVSLVYTIWGPYETRESTIAMYKMVYFAVLYLGVLCYSLIAFATEAFLFYHRYNQEQRRAADLGAELARAKLRALQMQLEPHFLFNTLHSISSLIFEDAQKANAMVARLGDFLRLTLDYSENQMVTLEREIDFLRCYLDIQKIRFEDRLAVRIEVDPSALSAQVPHLILQPIVENAVKHGFSKRMTHGTIEIEARRRNGMLWMNVRDDGPGIPSDGSGKAVKDGVGLSNIRGRLEQLYGSSYNLKMTNLPGSGLSVVLETPLTQKNGSAPYDPEFIDGSTEAASVDSRR